MIFEMKKDVRKGILFRIFALLEKPLLFYHNMDALQEGFW